MHERRFQAGIFESHKRLGGVAARRWMGWAWDGGLGSAGRRGGCDVRVRLPRPKPVRWGFAFGKSDTRPPRSCRRPARETPPAAGDGNPEISCSFLGKYAVIVLFDITAFWDVNGRRIHKNSMYPLPWRNVCLLS